MTNNEAIICLEKTLTQYKIELIARQRSISETWDSFMNYESRPLGDEKRDLNRWVDANLSVKRIEDCIEIIKLKIGELIMKHGE